MFLSDCERLALTPVPEIQLEYTVYPTPLCTQCLVQTVQQSLHTMIESLRAFISVRDWFCRILAQYFLLSNTKVVQYGTYHQLLETLGRSARRLSNLQSVR